MKSGAAGPAGPARTQLPLLPFRRGSYLHVEGRWHFMAGGPEATDRVPREDAEGRGSERLPVSVTRLEPSMPGACSF